MSKKFPETGNFNSKKEIENLSGYYFFSNFTHDEISLLLSCAEQVCYEKGEVIFSGEIFIRREKSGRELARLKPGKVFGEMAVLDGHPRSATAIAASEAELFAFDGARLLDNFPHLSVKLLRFMAGELSMLVRKADAMIDLI